MCNFFRNVPEYITMSKVKAVIIEDELPAARLLNKMLVGIRPEWDITVIPGTIEDAVKWFDENPHPDIIFLDIQLTDGVSFIFLEQAKPDCMIIFTTAYDEYAVRAFTVNSVDYLLKPISSERLLTAVEKFEKFHSTLKQQQLLNIEELVKSISQKKEKQYRTRFLIAGLKSFYVVNVNDISYFFSENKITFAVTTDGRKHSVDIPLSKLEEQLDATRFMRVNRQFILSAESIRGIQNYFNGKMILEVAPAFSGKILVSKEKVPLLKSWLSDFV